MSTTLGNTNEENKLIAQQEKQKADITQKVLSKITAFEQSGELTLPKDYNVENALKSAYLVLLETENKDKKKALEHCTQESIANSLLKMVVWGLSPLKKQCYFIMYGTKLECTPDYTGNIALAKRYANMKDIKANAIHQGDEFEFEVNAETGRKRVIKHKQTLESIGSKVILGAYAIYEMNDGTFDTEIMNFSQIEQAWKQGATNGKSPAHNNFPDRMARKTVINRACDALIRSSDDKALYDGEEEKEPYTVEEEVKETIALKANSKKLEATEVDYQEVPPVQVIDETPKSQVKENGQVDCGF